MYEVVYVNGDERQFDATYGAEVGKNVVLRRKTADGVEVVAKIAIADIRMWGYRAERTGA